jgi:hypothetical protein
MINKMTDIPGYGGKYLINKMGEVYSTSKKRLLTPTLSIKGYYVLTLNKTTRYLHQLLAETFIDFNYKNKGLCVDHINRNPKNNNLENLRLVTKSQNGINVTRPFRNCIFKRKENGRFRVIHKGFDKTFKEYNDAYQFRIKIQKELEDAKN